MWKWSLALPVLAAVCAASAQPDSGTVALANLREDLRGLSQRLDDLSLRVDQLEADHRARLDQAKSGASDYATLAQLNEAIAELNRSLQAAIAGAQEETLRQAGLQNQKLARPGTAAEAAAPAAGAAPGPFSTDFPKEGINYTVQKGDTLALIAKKTGAKLSDLINANKLADPSRIRVGQTLFVPGGK